MTRRRVGLAATMLNALLLITIFGVASLSADYVECFRNCDSGGTIECTCGGDECGCGCWGGPQAGCSCWCASGCATGADCGWI